MLFAVPPLGSYTTPRLTATGGTAFAGLIPPFLGPPGNSPYQYTVGSGGQANWLGAPGFGKTKVMTLTVTAGSTAHTVYVMRPLNFTYFTVAFAKNTTLIPAATLAADPGVYSTNYRYPTVGGVSGTTGIATTPPGQVADAAISSTNKYVAYQLADGTFFLDTIASGTYGSSLTLTTGTPNRTGGSVLAGAPFFYFGAVPGTLLDPADGQKAPGFDTIVSVLNTYGGSGGAEIVTALHAGDPLLVYDGNGTAADEVVASVLYLPW